MKDLVGGEERISDDEYRTWQDAFIVNLGTPEDEDKVIHPSDLDGWHVDGDFFVSPGSVQESRLFFEFTILHAGPLS